ncbi:hypothetical protein FXE78_17530 [Vibrio mimicus]|nr:hypothetical protein FXE78_17530 [Vibrio mimicus]
MLPDIKNSYRLLLKQKIINSSFMDFGDFPLNKAKFTPTHRQKIVKKNGKTGGKIHLTNPNHPLTESYPSPALCPLS